MKLGFVMTWLNVVDFSTAPVHSYRNAASQALVSDIRADYPVSQTWLGSDSTVAAAAAATSAVVFYGAGLMSARGGSSSVTTTELGL
jgi:hypothetical protein